MTTDGVHDYIRQTANGLQQDQLFNRIVVYRQNPLPQDVDLKSVLKKIEEKIPQFLFNDIDSIFIGQFSFLKEKEVSAIYEDGAIYLTNEQESEDDFYSDITHELAHAVEETYPLEIYGDRIIEQEFLAKRRSMSEILNAHGYNKFGVEKYFQTEYSIDFDLYLYEEVGYPILHTLLEGLFVSPYGATSLREYFANSFEEFYSGDVFYVKSISPAVYKKIVDIQS
jgi:hypothetical protein